MGKHNCNKCPPFFLAPPCTPWNHNSNFAGTWNVVCNQYTLDTPGDEFSLSNDLTGIKVTITATSDPRFYEISTYFFETPQNKLVGVVGINYDNCGKNIGYYLLNNGPNLPPFETQNKPYIQQLLGKLDPVAWDIHGNPIRLQTVGTFDSAIIQEPLPFQQSYTVFYATWTKV